MAFNAPPDPNQDLLNAMLNMSLHMPPPDSPSESRPHSDGTASPEQGGVHLSSPDSGLGMTRFYRNSFEGPPPSASYSATPVSGITEDIIRKHTPIPPPVLARGGFRNSRTWMSPDTKAMQDFVIIRNAMRRLFKDSFIALEWKYPDYVTHREAVVAHDKAQLEAKVKASEEEMAYRAAHPPSAEDIKYTRQLGAAVAKNLHFIGNRSLVLGEPTIWCVDWTNGKDEIAPWPSYAELKWEGDDRKPTSTAGPKHKTSANFIS